MSVKTKASEKGTMEADAVHAVKARKKENVMYLGPTITGVIRNSVVFKDGILPKKIQECVAKYPAMERLFVETDKVPGAVKELKKKQSALSAVYAQVAQKFTRRV